MLSKFYDIVDGNLLYLSFMLEAVYLYVSNRN